MNPMRIFEFIADRWTQFAPLVLLHVLVAVILATWILDPGAAENGRLYWQALASNSEGLGIAVDPGYLAAGVAITYFVVFRSMASLLGDLPGVRMSWHTTWTPNFLTHACHVLRSEPTTQSTGQIVEDLIHSYENEQRGDMDSRTGEAGRSLSTWVRWYEANSLMLFVVLVWMTCGGSNGARSTTRVAALAVLLALSTIFSRIQIPRKSRAQMEQQGYVVLNQFRRESAENLDGSGLEHVRRKMMLWDIRYWRAYYQSPAVIISNVSFRTSRRLHEALLPKLRFPLQNDVAQWSLKRSELSTFAGFMPAVPRALATSDFHSRFEALLECHGAGMCVLAPHESGVAPSVPSGGSSYCFATRTHGTSDLAIEYRHEGDFSRPAGFLSCSTAVAEWAFLADVGFYPIERLAQWDLPSTNCSEDWYQLVRQECEGAKALKGIRRREEISIGGIAVSGTKQLTVGHSYLLRQKDGNGVEAVVAFQCFEIGRGPLLLIAWKILWVGDGVASGILPNPWWKISGWTESLPKRSPSTMGAS